MPTADLHCHTTFSDGKSTPSQCVRKALNAGLDALAITDHNTVLGVEEAVEAARGTKLTIIKGCEVSTRQGHVLALYVQTAPKPNMPYKYTIDEIHEQRGLAVAAHPFSKNPKGVMRAFPRANLALFDAVEVLNGSPSMITHNAKAVQHWMSHMGDYAAVAGTDSHIFMTVGSVRTNYTGSLANSIKSKKTGIRLTPKELLS